MSFREFSFQGKLFFSFTVLLLIGIFYSHFLVSFSIALLFVLGFVNINRNPQISISYNSNWWSNTLAFVKLTPAWALWGIFALSIFSGFNSTNTQEWLGDLFLKLPYLLLVIAFANHKHIHKSYFKYLLLSLLLLCVVSTLPVLINYFLNFEEINIEISRGKSIPTPFQHTRYSVLLAFAFVLGLILWGEEYFKDVSIKRFLLFAAGFLFVFLHILSVRSGLAILYLVALYYACYYLMQRKKYLVLCLFAVLLFLIPTAAYYSIPSFHKKIHYSLYDLKMFAEGKGDNYSDSERIKSLKTSKVVFQLNKWAGTGIGDIKADFRAAHVALHGSDNFMRLPHNQFIYIACAMGILGFCLFIFFFLFPLFWKKSFQNPLIASLYLCIFLLCIVEKPLERTGFMVFFIIMILAYAQSLWSRKSQLSQHP